MFRQLIKTSLSNTRSYCTNTFGILKLNHVAIATQNLLQTSIYYRDTLGAKIVGEQNDQSDLGTSTLNAELGGTKIQFVAPFGPKTPSPLRDYLKINQNGGIIHICLEVDNINDVANVLKSKNAINKKDNPKNNSSGMLAVSLDSAPFEFSQKY